MLNDLIVDFDLASYADGCERKNVFRLGTEPFMSREALDGLSKENGQSLLQDLESIYYVFATFAAGYRRSIPKNDPLKAWRKGRLVDMQEAKEKHIEQLCCPFDDDLKGKIAIPVGDVVTTFRLENIRVEYREKVYELEGVARKQWEIELKELKALKHQAILEGKTLDEMELTLREKRNELEAARQSKRVTNTITFKKWMEAARFPVDEIHLECDCCEEE